MDTREFYEQPRVVGSYDQQRFGGASGARVNERELALVESLLPPGGRVLDLACGTGRLTHRLTSRGFEVVPLDTSAEMLRTTLAGMPAGAGVPGTSVPGAVLGDALALPFADATFDAVAAMRLLFHYVDVGPIVTEMARVCRPGGVLVFDTASWSPRARLALAARGWGGKVTVHRPDVLAAQLTALGLRVTARQRIFLVSPYLYRLLPLPAEHALEAFEAHTPIGWRSRVFWRVEVTEAAHRRGAPRELLRAG